MPFTIALARFRMPAGLLGVDVHEQAELLHAVMDLIPRHAEKLARPSLVPGGALRKPLPGIMKSYLPASAAGRPVRPRGKSSSSMVGPESDHRISFSSSTTRMLTAILQEQDPVLPGWPGHLVRWGFPGGASATNRVPILREGPKISYTGRTNSLGRGPDPAVARKGSPPRSTGGPSGTPGETIPAPWTTTSGPNSLLHPLHEPT